MNTRTENGSKLRGINDKIKYNTDNDHINNNYSVESNTNNNINNNDIDMIDNTSTINVSSAPADPYRLTVDDISVRLVFSGGDSLSSKLANAFNAMT